MDIHPYDGMNRATTLVRKTGAQDYIQTRVFRPGGELLSDKLSDPIFGTVQDPTFDSIDAFGRHLTVAVHGNVISPHYTYANRALSSDILAPRMTSTATWDAPGNSISYTDPNLQTVIHCDANGRVFQSDSIEEGATYTQQFTFDDLNHRKSLSDLLGTRPLYEPRADGNYTKITNLRPNSVTLELTALGELQRKRRADGMEVRYRRDPQRQTVYEGDPGAGLNIGFAPSLRLTNSMLRSGAAVSYGAFDPRSMPTAITIPGGSETRSYDLQRRLFDNISHDWMNPPADQWWSMPSDRHNLGANLSFADGHVEHWKWKSPKTYTKLYQNVAPAERLEWLRLRGCLKND